MGHLPAWDVENTVYTRVSGLCQSVSKTLARTSSVTYQPYRRHQSVSPTP